MRKYIIAILTFICTLPLCAQNNAEQLLQKTVSKLQKDGALAITLEAEIRDDNGTDIVDMELKLQGNCFYVKEEDDMLWFDGKTMWRANDFGEGVEEIYISEPTPEEKARYDIIALLSKHQGFSVSGNGTDTFILTASTPERSVEGIRKITVQVDADAMPKSIQIEFDQELGNISASVKITDHKTGQKFDKSTFTCPVKDYKDAEIIDLR